MADADNENGDEKIDWYHDEFGYYMVDIWNGQCNTMGDDNLHDAELHSPDSLRIKAKNGALQYRVEEAWHAERLRQRKVIEEAADKGHKVMFEIDDKNGRINMIRLNEPPDPKWMRDLDDEQ